MVQDSPRADDAGGAGQGCVQEECRGRGKGEGDYEGCSRMGGKFFLFSRFYQWSKKDTEVRVNIRVAGRQEVRQGARESRMKTAITVKYIIPTSDHYVPKTPFQTFAATRNNPQHNARMQNQVGDAGRHKILHERAASDEIWESHPSRGNPQAISPDALDFGVRFLRTGHLQRDRCPLHNDSSGCCAFPEPRWSVSQTQRMVETGRDSHFLHTEKTECKSV